MDALRKAVECVELPLSLDEVRVFMGERSDDHERYANPAGEYYNATDMRDFAIACLLAVRSLEPGTGDDGLAGAWPHPISGWVRGGDFAPVSARDAESRLAQGWQPVSHVPPSYSFDPATDNQENGNGL